MLRYVFIVIFAFHLFVQVVKSSARNLVIMELFS